MSLIIRPATDTDAAVITAWEREIFADDAWPRALVPLEATLVAQQGDDVVGYVVATVAGDVADLQRIATDSSARRRGVARQLLSAAVEQCRRLQAQRMLLEVRADNEGALAFYAAEGFERIDERSRYYRDGTSALVLRRVLQEGES